MSSDINIARPEKQSSTSGSITRGFARRALILLFLANLLNFYDRSIPGLLSENIKHEFGLTDTQLGLTASAALVIYAIAGIPLGRLADKANRVRVLGVGLSGWSVLTALNGLMPNAWSFTALRSAVGIGEASCAPAANSLVADMFLPAQRARAVGVMQLGIPAATVLAAFTVGPIAQASGNWRLPFFLAAIPGLLIAAAMFWMKEPPRGTREGAPTVRPAPVAHPIRAVLAIPSLRWIALSGAAFNFAMYGIANFGVPFLLRYFGIHLAGASVTTGVVTGVFGVAGLLLGGVVADRARRRSEQARLRVAVVALLTAAPILAVAFLLGKNAFAGYAVLSALATLLLFGMYSPVYASIYDVVEPRLRGTATAVYFIAMYVLGAAFGPFLIGAMSDWFAHLAAHGEVPTPAAVADGLRYALLASCPVALALAGVCVWRASRHILRDAAAMRRRQD
ncbi:spinster family MFS transporter [Amycolatopsis sp. NPDC049868]|uniref:spinster family MFS transporter n=1 Tax=Amycolatopsis sp. NPDC049868 TaxID=3363934 RepID=UPI00379F808F